jgi:hypothetical protein
MSNDHHEANISLECTISYKKEIKLIYCIKNSIKISSIYNGALTCIEMKPDILITFLPALRSSDLNAAIQCALHIKSIQGFVAWTTYERYCVGPTIQQYQQVVHTLCSRGSGSMFL